MDKHISVIFGPVHDWFSLLDDRKGSLNPFSLLSAHGPTLSSSSLPEQCQRDSDKIRRSRGTERERPRLKPVHEPREQKTMPAPGATCPPGGVSVLHRAHLLLAATRPRKYRYPVADWLTRIEIPDRGNIVFHLQRRFRSQCTRSTIEVGSMRKFRKIYFPLFWIDRTD